MSKLVIVSLCVIVASIKAEPLLFSAPLIASPYTSAAYFSPSASVVAAPVASVSPVPAAVPAVSTVPAAVPFSSVSAYSYGSSYSIQDYLPATAVVNPSASLAYSLPYAYAADYFYRR